MNFDVTIEKPEIQHFFEVYKELEPGKVVEAARWVGAADALAEIEDCRKRLADSEGGIPENHPSVASRGASRVLVIYGRH